MANVLDYQVTQEGQRNAIVKLTGYLDTSNVSEISIIPLSLFKDNDPFKTLTGFRIDLIEWSVSNPLEVNLQWNSATPKQIYLLAGRGRIVSTNYGGFVPDPLRPGYDGSINLVTANYQAGSIANFSVILELIKLYS